MKTLGEILWVALRGARAADFPCFPPLIPLPKPYFSFFFLFAGETLTQDPLQTGSLTYTITCDIRKRKGLKVRRRGFGCVFSGLLAAWLTRIRLIEVLNEFLWRK